MGWWFERLHMSSQAAFWVYLNILTLLHGTVKDVQDTEKKTVGCPEVTQKEIERKGTKKTFLSTWMLHARVLVLPQLPVLSCHIPELSKCPSTQ